ncbi:cohesin domain-containing protein [Pseudoduganella buxea]|nr:cohesin domain-containing protein [Pseudoduganella buxea]GGC05636.1 hypothetical protein GCM10011572_29390 [Pseudoduganella buxea]
MSHRMTTRILHALTGLLVALSFHAVAIPILSTNVSTPSIGMGQMFSVSIQVDDVNDLYAYQFDLAFDPGLVAIAGVVEGSFLPGGGPTIFNPGLVDNTTGRLSFTLGSLIDDFPGVSGSGELVRVDFMALLATGTTSFELENFILLDSSLLDIAASPPLAGAVTVVPTPPSLALMVPLLLWLGWARRPRS